MTGEVHTYVAYDRPRSIDYSPMYCMGGSPNVASLYLEILFQSIDLLTILDDVISLLLVNYVLTLFPIAQNLCIHTPPSPDLT